ncbi:prepilin-type N-terminal cleavage/methylation domain-containing protein, partial [Patescibacteria group bacterium]|nr:prepilin-type N-terminal cleavage/methylation domain-containing protein [Patescibacteria group bacterium]
MRQKAFTFIEMITVLGLFVLLLSGGMVYMNDFK